MFDLGRSAGRVKAALPSIPELDRALLAQLSVAWAGEGAKEEKRLGWWHSDFVSRYGGQDLFHRLLPNTWEWAVLQAAREAARRKDAEIRAQDHDPDRILSLFSFGFELDERIEERLQDLKASGRSPHDALPGLKDVIEPVWNRDRFLNWVRGHGEAETTTAPTGRRIAGTPPGSLDLVVARLVSALAPLADSYPLPHFRRSA